MSDQQLAVGDRVRHRYSGWEGVVELQIRQGVGNIESQFRILWDNSSLRGVYEPSSLEKIG